MPVTYNPDKPCPGEYAAKQLQTRKKIAQDLILLITEDELKDLPLDVKRKYIDWEDLVRRRPESILARNYLANQFVVELSEAKASVSAEVKEKLDLWVVFNVKVV